MMRLIGQKTGTRALLVMLTLAVGSLGLVGCGEDSNGGGNGIVDPTDTGSNDDTGGGGGGDADDTGAGGDVGDTGGTGGDADTGSTDPCQGVTCDPGEVCRDGSCFAEGSDCTASATDIGEIGAGTTVETVQAGSQTPDTLQSSCVADGQQAPEVILQFTAGVTANVEIDVSSELIDWVVAVREGSCSSASEEIMCDDSEVGNVFGVTQGETYYVIAEPKDQFSVEPVEFSLTVTETQCQAGSRTCNGDSVDFCFGGTEVRNYACADTCTSGACAGDTCANAIEVSASQTFTGDIAAYTSKLDFDGNAGCDNLASPGQDVIFRLTGLSAGQTVTVDTNADNIGNLFYVLDSCDDSAACLHVSDNDPNEPFNNQDRTSWEVGADGDYFLVVDRNAFTAQSFNYAIDIQ